MKNNEDLEKILEKLNILQSKLSEIKNYTETGNKIETMKSEIINIGWEGILDKYHPDVNIDDPAAMDIFLMYKSLYSHMIKSGEISKKNDNE
jgi:hypothetical protein